MVRRLLAVLRFMGGGLWLACKVDTAPLHTLLLVLCRNVQPPSRGPIIFV